jgi:hypothetical protein
VEDDAVKRVLIACCETYKKLALLIMLIKNVNRQVILDSARGK